MEPSQDATPKLIGRVIRRDIAFDGKPSLSIGVGKDTYEASTTGSGWICIGSNVGGTFLSDPDQLKAKTSIALPENQCHAE